MNKRILLLYTGGTIGMDHTPQGLAPVPGLLPRLIQRLEAPGREVSVVEYPELIDSSAITPAHWNRLIADIAASYDAYDGFVVVHGTDTMAYTASVLAFALRGLGKPVVVTGSQLPLVHPRSDGWANLADALEAASQDALHEVVIAFDRVLLRGCRASKVDCASFAGFDSPNARPLARFGIAPEWRRELWRRSEAPFAVQRLDEGLCVVSFWLTPGHASAMAGEAMAAGRLDGALLFSYGNGNAPADPVLLAGVAALSHAGGAVINLTQCVSGAVQVGAYAAGGPLAQSGAVAGADLTPEAAYAKLLVGLSQGLRGATLRAYLETVQAGEMSV